MPYLGGVHTHYGQPFRTAKSVLSGVQTYLWSNAQRRDGRWSLLPEDAPPTLDEEEELKSDILARMQSAEGADTGAQPHLHSFTSD